MTSGSTRALVLPPAHPDDGTPPVGQRATELLRSFLDPTECTAVAVVHGLGSSAPRALDQAKLVLRHARGVVWLPDPKLLPLLTEPDLPRLLAPRSGFLVRFYHVRDRRLVEALDLEWFRATSAEIDLRFSDAELS